MRQILLITILALSIASCSKESKVTNINRTSDFNFDWKFTFLKDTTSLLKTPLIDKDWRDVRLPHDWSIEHSRDSTLEGCTGYFPGGVGVYQKHFKTPALPKDKSTYVLFDGVYNNSKYWINGQYIGENPYGYSPVHFNLTDKLKIDGSDNVITVYVDHSRYADSRWYTGSGIYRNVKLITVDKLHVPIWGTYITTPEVSEEKSLVKIETKVKNQRDKEANFTLSTSLLNKEGKEIAKFQSSESIKADLEGKVIHEIEVVNPELWNPENPNMYKAITTIIKDGEIIDEYITPFGIRNFKHDKEKGLFLNGKSIYAKGVCLHHDGGLVGAAVPKGVWKRRLAKLKEGGVNAIRTSHNPFSAEFLDLCDEMGFLVQNEFFDEMDNPKDKRFNKENKHSDYITRGYTMHFQEWAKSDLQRVMLRDRNHPSVFEWSIGNEIEWTYPHYRHVSGFWDADNETGYWNAIPKLSPEEMKARYEALPDRKYKLAETANELAKWTKELDTTRPVTANLIIPVASCATGYAEALDVVGFSYHVAQYNWAKINYPEMHFTGTENSGYLSEWLSVIENPMVYSMYMWTGIDYLGEDVEFWPPAKTWGGDIMDFGGFTKTKWNYFKSIWVNKPHISIGTLPLEGSYFKFDPLKGKPVKADAKAYNWYNNNAHWNYKKGEMILVEVSSNLSVVELFLNGESLGSRSMSECPDRIFRWAVPFKEGVLEAKAGFIGEQIVATSQTADKPVDFKVDIDKTELKADGYDVSHFEVQLIDKNGIPVKTKEVKVTFLADENIRLLGVDNGSSANVQDFQSNSLVTSKGRALAIFQSKRISGAVKVKVHVEGIGEKEMLLNVNK
ncbi:uncharacterized protein DUF4982 [Maribacter vaceletii]|uniref:Uncharacterized protein DUF4982 n=1 Tax=Maribacter vaceletii TaxID=1206816 RepID=A0A495DU66_9FLAO|nr:glycoside hydrolase family 2 TIM barrel-domain containing protein [Maribacter vaceletii]RKR07988.1 uncharacterized protein DUF4982 [Maribacter vaceletii]